MKLVCCRGWCSCEEVDVVSVYVTMNDVRREIGSFCGSKLPAPLMSPNAQMQLVFISRTLPDTKNYRGFNVSFSFVRGTLRSPDRHCCYASVSTVSDAAVCTIACSFYALRRSGDAQHATVHI